MTQDDLLKGLGVVEALSRVLPGDVGRYTHEAVLLAQDFARAGKGPEDLAELRKSIRSDWERALDERFGRK